MLAALLGGAPAFGADPWDVMFEQPLVKWALVIGETKSLPWKDAAVWDATMPGYDAGRAAAETLEILSPGTPVLARMETMRRAIVYSRVDPGVAYQILAALDRRVQEAQVSGKADALAIFDLGYFFEACRQAAWLKTEWLGDRNGYALVIQASQFLGASFPERLEIQFAAGLILLEPKGQHPYYPHFKTVVKEAKEGTLLEKNLVTHLRRTFEADSLEAMRKSKYLLR